MITIRLVLSIILVLLCLVNSIIRRIDKKIFYKMIDNPEGLERLYKKHKAFKLISSIIAWICLPITLAVVFMLVLGFIQ